MRGVRGIARCPTIPCLLTRLQRQLLHLQPPSRLPSLVPSRRGRGRGIGTETRIRVLGRLAPVRGHPWRAVVPRRVPLMRCEGAWPPLCLIPQHEKNDAARSPRYSRRDEVFCTFCRVSSCVLVRCSPLTRYLVDCRPDPIRFTALDGPTVQPSSTIPCSHYKHSGNCHRTVRKTVPFLFILGLTRAASAQWCPCT